MSKHESTLNPMAHRQSDHPSNQTTRVRFDPRGAVKSSSPVIARIAASSIAETDELTWRGRSVASHPRMPRTRKAEKS